MRLASDRGTIAVTTLVLLPVLLVIAGAVLELGQLRVLASRARAAADLATLVAIDDQDDAELARTGHLRPSADAVDVAREYFARNLAPIASLLDSDPQTIAAEADVAIFGDVPATDPLTGERYEHPTARLSALVPVRTPVLAAILGSAVTRVPVRAASAAR
jgi:Flp pilus assembly protein TadG